MHGGYYLDACLLAGIGSARAPWLAVVNRPAGTMDIYGERRDKAGRARRGYIWRWPVVGGAGKRGWIAGQGLGAIQAQRGADSDARGDLCPDLSLPGRPGPRVFLLAY